MSRSSSNDLNWLFYPQSVAVIGASADDQKEKVGWTGRLLDFGFQGQLYPINPQAERILGIKSYPSILDVPDQIDYAIIGVRAAVVPKVLEQCVIKKVKAAHVYTAGFGETGTERGKRLQEDVSRIMREGSMRIIGPNCMGIYCPASGMTFNARFSKEKGCVGIVSQSGAALLRLIPGGNKRGIYFSKVMSYGNAVDMDSPDFLEYLARDEETKLVFCYVEGVKDGRGFYKAIRECIQRKPVIMLKGGLTEGGIGAAASHTASLAGSEHIWRALFKQTGVIPVDSFEEVIEQMVAVQFLGTSQIRGVGVVSRGGGPGVVTTDMCERAGLLVPALTAETKEQLKKIIPVDSGSGIRNPVEIGLSRYGLSQDYGKALQIVASDPKIDVILTRIGVESYIQYGVGNEDIDAATGVLIETAKTLAKPLAVVVDVGLTLEAIAPALKAQEKLSTAGLAVFSTMQAAVSAISKVSRYQEFSRLNI